MMRLQAEINKLGVFCVVVVLLGFHARVGNVIDFDGNIYQARDIRFAGDTNTEYDPAGHALIEVVGNFEEIEPNPSQLAAVTILMTMLAQKYSVPPDAIRGHRDYSTATECPGKNLYRYLAEGYFHKRVRANLASMNKFLN